MVHDGFGRRDRFLRALDAVEAATDLAGLKRAIDGMIAPYGLKHAVFLAHAHTVARQDIVLFTYPSDWVEHYIRRRYYEVDPVLRAGARSIAPVDWATLDRSPHAVRRLFGEAEDAGVGRQGLTLASRGPSGTPAALNVTADVSDRDWPALRDELMRDMAVIGSHLHARLLALDGVAPAAAAARLSARERETLQWAAVGKTIDQTAMILGLSSSAVRTYLDAARRKLNCFTKPQAVAVAMRRGLIDG